MPESLVWTRDDGLVLDLSDGVSYKLRHHDGFGMPPFDPITVSVPTIEGDFWLGSHFNARVVTIDLVLNADTLAALQARRAEIISAVNPRHQGTLTLTQSNGVVRAFDCALGAQASMPTSQHIGRSHMGLQLQFRSVGNPALYDPVKQSLIISTAGSLGFSFPWQFPFQLARSQVYAQPVVNNPGDLETPVEITLTGPGQEPIFRNDTLNQRVSFAGGVAPFFIAQGGNLYLSMDQRRRRVQRYGVDIWNALTEADFWTLQPGANSLFFDIGATTTDTVLKIEWYNRYLGV